MGITNTLGTKDRSCALQTDGLSTAEARAQEGSLRESLFQA